MHGFATARDTTVPFGNGEKTHFLFFSFRYRHGFASARGTVVLSRESRPCLSEMKKNMFSIFFLSRESRFCFRERHGYDFARGTGVPLSEREKTVLPVWFFRPFFLRKSSSKPINMKSSFEDLDAGNLTVKTLRDLYARLKR